MDQPCPTCGNRQHSPGSTRCRVCGEILNDNANYEPEGNNDSFPITRSGFTENTEIRPVLIDRAGNHYNIDPLIDNQVGSAQSANVRITGSEIKPQHARVFSSNGRYLIEAMVGCIVLVNGRAIGRTVYQLNNYDIVSFSEKNAFIFQLSSSFSNNRIEAIDINENGIRSSLQTTTRHERIEDFDLYGRVRHIDGPYLENPDPTIGKMIGKGVKIALAAWKPAFFLLGNSNQQTPVRILRVENNEREITIVKMKGELITGAIHTGDMVFFWGNWNQGTLIMNRAYNETARTYVSLRK